jgi:hypothetical protein
MRSGRTNPCWRRARRASSRSSCSRPGHPALTIRIRTIRQHAMAASALAEPRAAYHRESGDGRRGGPSRASRVLRGGPGVAAGTRHGHQRIRAGPRGPGDCDLVCDRTATAPPAHGRRRAGARARRGGGRGRSPPGGRPARRDPGGCTRRLRTVHPRGPPTPTVSHSRGARARTPRSATPRSPCPGRMPAPASHACPHDGRRAGPCVRRVAVQP